jgi:hypothetical protein
MRYGLLARTVWNTDGRNSGTGSGGGEGGRACPRIPVERAPELEHDLLDQIRTIRRVAAVGVANLVENLLMVFHEG